MLVAILAEYWIEFLCGLVVTGLGFICRKFYSLWKKEQEHTKELEQNNLKNSINEELLKTIESNRQESLAADERLSAAIQAVSEEVSTLKGGILSLQGGEFKKECRRLLAEDHVITFAEWDSLNEEHSVYNSLGGNHEGDRLFKDVENKYKK